MSNSNHRKMATAAIVILLMAIGIVWFLSSRSNSKPTAPAPTGEAVVPSEPQLSAEQGGQLDKLVAELKEQEDRYRSLELDEVVTTSYFTSGIEVPPEKRAQLTGPTGDYLTTIRQAHEDGLETFTSVESIRNEYHLVSNEDRYLIDGSVDAVFLLRTKARTARDDEAQFQLLNTMHEMQEAWDGESHVAVFAGNLSRHDSVQEKLHPFVPHTLFKETTIKPHDVLLSKIIALKGDSHDLKLPWTNNDGSVACDVSELELGDGTRSPELVFKLHDSEGDQGPTQIAEIVVRLNRERNLIPDLVTEYEGNRLSGLKRFEYKVIKWQECAPGVWYPSRTNRKTYEDRVPGDRVMATEAKSDCTVHSLTPDKTAEFYQQAVQELFLTAEKQPPSP